MVKRGFFMHALVLLMPYIKDSFVAVATGMKLAKPVIKASVNRHGLNTFRSRNHRVSPA
jgi:hypothetical protein